MFPKILKKLRLENDLTQKELAKKLNMQNTAISKYELGERESDITTLDELAKFFNVSTDYLLGRTDQRNPKEPELPTEFTGPEEAMKFILEQPAIMGFGGFDINKMDDDEVVEFANESLRQLKLLSYKYKK